MIAMDSPVAKGANSASTPAMTAMTPTAMPIPE